MLVVVAVLGAALMVLLMVVIVLVLVLRFLLFDLPRICFGREQQDEPLTTPQPDKSAWTMSTPTPPPPTPDNTH